MKQKHIVLLVLCVHLYKYIYHSFFVTITVDVIYLTTDVKMYTDDENDRRDDNIVRLLVFLRTSDNRDYTINGLLN